MPLQVTAFQVDTLRQGAHIRQRGTFVEATKVARYQTRFSIRYEYRISDCIIESTNDVCTQAAEALLPGFDRSITNIKISSLTPTFFWDRRDDPLDPHHGFLTSASFQYAFRALDADAHFLKEFTQAAWYLPVSERSVFAVSGRIGLIQDLGGGRGTAGERLTGVPISERFTAGGESSHRSFPLDLLGTTCADPRDGGADCQRTLVEIVDNNGDVLVAPLGGLGVAILNAEYRFPIAGPVGAILFGDAGNVFAKPTMNLRLRYGFGAGIMYSSPLGPIRADLGYNPAPRILRYGELGNPIYERRFVYFITIGHPF
jgi:outer membrane protein assembly factor BamA